MVKEFVIKGLWFVNKELKIPGELKYDPIAGIELNLNGIFSEYDIDYLQRKNYSGEKIIYGISDNGIKISLFNCLRTEFTYNHGTKISSSKFDIELCIKGVHLLNLDEALFFSVRIGLKNLNSWYGKTGLSFIPQYKDEFAVQFNRPESRIITINHLECQFLLGFNATTKLRSVNLEEYASFEIKSHKGFRFIKLQSHINKMKKFIALMTYEQTFFTKVVATFKNEHDINVKKEIEAELIFKDYSYYVSKKDLSWGNMLFTFEHIGYDIENIMSRWFEQHDKIKPVYNLLFYSFRKSTQFVEEFFMDMARAIEVWHRRTYSYKIMDDVSFQNFINKTKSNEAFNNEEKKILDKILEYANEPSLRKRLKDVYEQYGFIFDFDKKQQKQFINDIVNSRNYFTHYNPELKNAAKSGIELDNLAIKLRALLISAILSQLGVSEQLIKDRVNQIIIRELNFR